METMEETFEVKYGSSEDEFIYNSGVNRGHTPVPLKVTRCYLIDSSARFLYGLLKSFMHGDSRSCFPSIEKLMDLSGWSRSTVKKHMEGLQDAQLATYEEREGRSNLYIIEPLHKSTTIAHSEMIHSIKAEYFKGNDRKFNLLKSTYLKSSFFEKVKSSFNPLEYYEAVREWFLNDGSEVAPVKKEPAKVPPTNVSRGLNHLTAIASKSKQVSNVTRSDDFNVMSDPEKTKKKRVDRDYRKAELEDWNVHHFIKFFDDMYLDKMNFAMPTDRGDLAQLKALKERYGNEKLKERILLFFESPSFQKAKKSIYTFSAAHIQTSIDKILNFGESNSYKANERPLEQSEQEQINQWKKEMTKEKPTDVQVDKEQLEQWLKDMSGGS